MLCACVVILVKVPSEDVNLAITSHLLNSNESQRGKRENMQECTRFRASRTVTDEVFELFIAGIATKSLERFELAV